MKVSKEQYFTRTETLAWEEMAPGMRRKIAAYGDQLMAVHVAFEKGAVGQTHHHPHVQISYVARGAFDVHINGVHETLGEGDYFYVPPDAPHGVTALEEGILIDTFTPKREDFVAD